MTEDRPWRADGTRHDQLLLMRKVPKVDQAATMEPENQRVL